MDEDKTKRGKDPIHVSESLHDILARFSALGAKAASPESSRPQPTPPPAAEPPVPVTSTAAASPAPCTPGEEPEDDIEPGRYDFDLAEFPIFRFSKPKRPSHTRDPLVYTDTISGEGGQQIVREWKAFPGAFGFGGSSAQELFYELLQLYVEQGCRGSQIQFGTLRALFHRMQPERHPSVRDFNRLRRDIDILRGYDFHCKNAFWDRERRAYVDKHWRLFGDVFYFKPHPDSRQQELPFGFIEASSTLQEIARSRGFFCLGFGSRLFHRLKPLEQRLAVYLAKKFMSQEKHQRFAEDLAAALPIEASRADNVRTILHQVASGLLEAGVPILERYEFQKSERSGRWLAVFYRRIPPAQDYRLPDGANEALSAALQVVVDDMIAAAGNPDDRLWWMQCAKRLGAATCYEALSELKDASHRQHVRSPGRMLTKILKDKAKRRGLSLH